MKVMMRSLIAVVVALSLSAPVWADEATTTSTDTQATATQTLDQQTVTAEQVNVNTADAKTISSALKGVGMKKAEAIVDYRTKNGPFKTVDDLTNVKGFSKKLLEKNRDKITVD